MDRILPDARALPYVDRLARLTEIRAYTRAQYLQENTNLDWTDIGAKVKKLIDDRIDAERPEADGARVGAGRGLRGEGRFAAS